MRNDVLIEAVTPPNPEGMLPVEVVNPDGQEAIKRERSETIGELAYNFPDSFCPSRGTTFRYVTNERVQEIIVRIFNLNGEPIDTVHGSRLSEVRWFNSDLRIGLLMEVKLESGQTRAFKRLLEARSSSRPKVSGLFTFRRGRPIRQRRLDVRFRYDPKPA